MNKRIAVIGAGFAGLGVATALSLRGCEVTLLDASPRAGGLAAGLRQPEWNWSAEHFYHHWFRSDAALIKHCEIWGVQDKLIFKRPLTCMETKNHGFVQLDSPLSLLRFPELSLASRLRMGAVLAWLKTKRDWKDLDDIAAATWCRRAMGKAGYEAIWGELMRGKFGPFAEQVNMAWLWARLHCRTPELGTYVGGFDALIDDVSEWLTRRGVEIKLGVTDVRVNRAGAQLEVRAASSTRIFDSVVICAGPEAFRATCGDIAPLHVAQLKRNRALGAQVIVLSLKRPVGKFYWYSLRKERERPFLCLVEHTNFASVEDFNGEHIAYVADYLDLEDPRWSLSDDALVSDALQTIKHVNPDLQRDQVNRTWVFRAPYAQPVPMVGASRLVPPTDVTEVPGLHHISLAHVYPWDRGTNYALELGSSVGERIARA